MINGIMLHHSRLKGRSAGFSLIEIMVAMAIGLLLMAGLLSVVVNTNQSYGELNKASLRLENGRYAMQVLTDDIQHAGFYGEYFNIPSPPAALPDPCATAPANLQAALPLPIQGYEAPATSPLSCLPSANHLTGTDILVIRRVSTATTAVDALKEGMVYLQGRTGDVVLNAAASGSEQNQAIFNLTKKDGTTRADIREFSTAIYFISPCSIPASGSTCSASADGGNPIPTLKRIELTHSGTSTTMRTTPLVEGIENLQIEYGIDRSGDGAPNESGLGTGDAYVTNPATTTEWSNGVALRLFLLARSIQSSAGHQDAKAYDLGQAGTAGPFNDAYKRHLFSAAVRVINPSSRRETP